MEKLVVKIYATKDGYGAYSENCDLIFAAGDTLDACKNDVYNAIDALKGSWKEENIPDMLKGEIEIEWKYEKYRERCIEYKADEIDAAKMD